MTTKLDTRIRRTLGMLAAAIAIVLVGAASALAGGPPSASYYTKQQLETMSQSWAAKAAVSTSSPAERQAKLQAILGTDATRPAASYYTKQQLETMSQSWAAKAASELRDLAQTRSAANSGVDWGDFGIGAGSMFGLVLLLGGGFLAVHFGRRPSDAPAHRLS
jgi:hypothetical protein